MFQELFVKEPFWMTVGCVLLNRASWRQAERPHAELRRYWPTPERLASASVDEVAAVVRPVGFGEQRAARLVKLAAAWARRPPKTAEDVLALPGCGPYAAGSFAIFVEGRTDLEPTDHYLAAHLKKVRESSQKSLYSPN